jgi:hypothetical protein
MLTNIHKNFVGLIFHKFVRNFTHICEKILQICVKLGKSCLVGSGPGVLVMFHRQVLLFSIEPLEAGAVPARCSPRPTSKGATHDPHDPQEQLPSAPNDHYSPRN